MNIDNYTDLGVLITVSYIFDEHINKRVNYSLFNVGDFKKKS